MIAVDYPRLRMRGQVKEMPAEGLVLVNWDKGGSTRIPVDELKMVYKHCTCGHQLHQHPPVPERPFAWPCLLCECDEYAEEKSR